MEGNKSTSKFTWKIEKFSKLTEKKIYSEIFTADGCKWRLLIFPKGNNTNCLSIYIDVPDSTSLSNGWSRDTKFSLEVVNQSNNNSTIKKETHHVFNSEEKDWGFASFIELSKINDPSQKYLLKDTLIVEAEINVRCAIPKEPSSDETSNQAPKSDILQLNEALEGFFNMSLEAIQQANAFGNIEGIILKLIQNTNNLYKKKILEDLASCLKEFQEIIPSAKAIVETTQARRTSLREKTTNLDSTLGQKEQSFLLEAELLKVSKEEEKIQAEIERLMTQKEELNAHKKSVASQLEKDLEDRQNLEREIKQANAEWLGAKEKLASANFRWKLFKEDLGLGKDFM